MAWTTPKIDWETGDLVAASDLNAIGDNFNILKDQSDNYSQYTIPQGTGYSTSLTTWADVDATNLDLSLTTSGGIVLVAFHSHFQASGSNRTLNLDVMVDGTRIGGDDGLVSDYLQNKGTSNTNNTNISFVRLIDGLSAGAHTFKLQWKVSGLTNMNDSGGSTHETTSQFWVKEL